MPQNMPPSPQHVPNPLSNQWYKTNDQRLIPTGLTTDPWNQNGIGNLSAQLEASNLNDEESIPSSAGKYVQRGSGPILEDVRRPPASMAPSTTLTLSDQQSSIPLDDIRFRNPPKLPLGPSGRENRNLIDFEAKDKDPSTMSAPRNDAPEFEITNWNKDSSRTSSMNSGSLTGVTSTKNPINELQEYVVSNRLKHPQYIEDRGMDGLFSVKCIVDGNCLEESLWLIKY